MKPSARPRECKDISKSRDRSGADPHGGCFHEYHAESDFQRRTAGQIKDVLWLLYQQFSYVPALAVAESGLCPCRGTVRGNLSVTVPNNLLREALGDELVWQTIYNTESQASVATCLRRSGDTDRDRGRTLWILMWEMFLKLKKQHPCGSREWEVLRVGADFRLKCLGCGHQIMIAQKLVEKNVKEIVEKS